jgi:hypothetical protein
VANELKDPSARFKDGVNLGSTVTIERMTREPLSQADYAL